MPQLKKLAFLVPRPGSTSEEFMAYWADVHGPLVAGSPGYAAYRRRYLQNHLVGVPVGAPFPYAGMAEFWLPGDNEDDFAATDIYRDRIGPDEQRFIDMDRTISFTAQEHVLREGTGPVKLVVVRRREPTASDVAAADGLRGAVANAVLEGSGRLPGARPVADPIVRVDELWFDAEDAARAAIELLEPDAGWSAFVATEHVYFEA
jgi:uncharacterized protein (TIGR02118 family)